MSEQVGVGRKLHLLRTMNPTGMQHGVTEDGAVLCRWAADSIELLAKYLNDVPSTAYLVCKDKRLKELMS